MEREEAIRKCPPIILDPCPTYLKPISAFSSDEIPKAKREINTYKPLNYENTKGVWILVGYIDFCKKWICLEVGSSNDIIAEIRECISNMNSIQGEIKKGSYFYPDSELFTHPTYATKECCKYRTIKDTFSEFKWYQIEPYEYLKIISPSYKESEPLLYDKKKLDIINFIESHISFSYKPLFWNPAPQTYGNQEAMLIKMFRDHAKEELKIENNEIVFKNTNL